MSQVCFIKINPWANVSASILRVKIYRVCRNDKMGRKKVSGRERILFSVGSIYVLNIEHILKAINTA